MPSVLRIALPVPLPTLFDYLPPASGQAVAGSRVLVPFGRGKAVGVVVETDVDSNVGSARLKRVSRVLDDAPLLDAELMQTLAWAADYWLGAPGEAYANALPLLLREDKPLPETREPAWQLTIAGLSALDAGSRRGGSRALLQVLAEGPQSATELDLALPDWRAAARRLADAGLIERGELAMSPMPQPSLRPPVLHPEQEAAVSAVAAAFDRFQPFLLDGITGSGKTEVYLALIEQALAQDKQTLLLVPEIGLAPQTVRRLRERLGVPVEVLHSNLAEGERARAWLRMRSGESKVVLGTRSAVFTPLPQAGLIIVDEEHDGAYKQQEGFRYHARDLALVRGRALNVPVMLGSATPSLESLANVEAGRYQALHLRSRPSAVRPPQVQIIDMRAQRLEHGLSPALLHTVGETVARGEQVLVFRNRRGYAPVLLCHSCGWHAECPRCEHPMTLHAAWRRLICHHCDHQSAIPTTCPACGSNELKPQGQGTERLEEALTAHFPQTPVLRIDRETTRRRDAFEQLLANLQADAPVILVGTQMLAKGHDLPNLTLVAIVGVDEGLLSVDFRAGERLAQLVVQVAGRAGRASKPGRVLLQTHHPDHPLLRSLLSQGYAAAAKDLLVERHQTGLPPFGHQVLLRAEAHERMTVDAFLGEARAALPDTDTLQIAGPMPAPMPLRAGRQRGQLLIESTTRRHLHAAVRPWSLQLAQLPSARKVRWSLDVDPVDLY
ncbi:primosomal protein N' [Dyella caseinilytica]|uniref:Replication restart protein PriA n=1 Tax=Dyella caseinilytica TaxID=1849581 RepID=A0ABX7GRY9_9GAMM|nr:primosomal protein N' [Dyella caseinilytica]QRN53197.1 primosomal protein N' [Dyella caseinilytica]GGA12189.1 primosomal protein N' [Dyella caseinilytica]